MDIRRSGKVLKYYEKFVPDWLHNISRNQLLSPQLDWHFPGYGGYSTDPKNASFAKQPFDINSNYADWSGVESLTYILDYWIEENKDWMKFQHLSRCLINFYTSSQNTGWHIDHEDPRYFSLLYYVNESDGGTEFEDGNQIFHRENSGLIFQSKILHTPIQSTVPRRISVNWIFLGEPH